jgi:hypothetical protein
MAMRDKIGLSTATSSDLKGAVYAIAGVLVTMDPGWERTYLISLFLIVMAVISWLTVGNIPPQMAEDVKEIMDSKSVKDVLREGRE